MPDIQDDTAWFQGELAKRGISNPTQTQPSAPQTGNADADWFQSQLGAKLAPQSQSQVGIAQMQPIGDEGTTLNIPDLRNIPSTSSAEFVTPEKFAQQSFEQTNQEGNIPLDTQSGLDALTRLRLGFHRNKSEQLNILRNLYGQENIRMDNEGNFIARLTDEKGKQKDVLVDEKGMSAKDLLDLSSEYPAFALSLLTTKGVPVGAVMKGALRSAAGYALGGALTDAGSQAAEHLPVDTSEVLQHRGSEMVLNSLFGYGLGKGIQAIGSLGKLGRVAASKLGDTTQAEAMSAAQMGREATEKRFGIEMPTTAAGLTGNPMLLRLETFLSNIPLVRGTILKNWARQVENEKAIQSAFLGGKPVDEAGTGQKIIDLLQGEMSRQENIAGKAADITRRQATEAVTDPLSDISGKPISAFSFGSRMITRGEAQLQSFKARANEMFGEIKKQPDIDLPYFDTTPIKDEAKKLVGEKLISGAEGETLKALAPTGLLSVVDDIKKLPEQQSYFDLVHLREAIYDRIGSPEPISDRANFMLKRIGAKITQELKSQSKSVLDPNTQAMIGKANEFYSKNVDTFYQKGVSEMLKPRTESGAIDPELIASRLLAGGKGSVTTLKTLGEFFEKPQAMQDMARLLRDHIIDSGTDPATGLVKLESLGTAVSKMEPEVVKSLFGIPKDQILNAVQQGQTALRVSGKVGAVPMRGTQGAVEADALKQALASGKVDSMAIRKLVQANKDLTSQYGNAVRKAVSENDLGVIEASPDNFVEKYLTNPSIPANDVRNVMQSIYRSGNQELVEDIRRVYLAKVFSESAKVSKGDVGQIVARIKGTPLRELDPQKFSIALENAPDRARMELILGPDTFAGLKNFATAVAGRAPKDTIGALQGGLVGGGVFHKLLTGLEGLSEMPQYIALSFLVTNPKAIAMLKAGNKIAPASLDKLIKPALLTPEFLRVLAADSPTSEDARKSAEEIKKWASPKQ